MGCHGLIEPANPALSSLAVTAAPPDDGFLSTMEVFRLRIPADLVVLSACETGRDTYVEGEGMTGLVRAFMFAGAPRVIASLWRVDDAATSALMKEFYARWAKNEPAAKALKAAQDFVRGKPEWSHPKFWAAWNLFGLPD